MSESKNLCSLQDDDLDKESTIDNLEEKLSELCFHGARTNKSESILLDLLKFSAKVLGTKVTNTGSIELLELLSSQCVQLITSGETSESSRVVALSIALSVSKKNPAVANRIIWTSLFESMIYLMHHKVMTPIQLSQVLDSVKIAEVIMELPDTTARGFYAFKSTWIGYFAVYAGICDYLAQPVVDVNDTDLKAAQTLLGNFILKTVTFVYELSVGEGHNTKLAEYCIMLIIGDAKSSKLSISPTLIRILDSSSENIDPLTTFERISTELISRPELCSRISSKVVHLFNLVAKNVDANSDLVKVLFAQFMQFRSQAMQPSPGHGTMLGHSTNTNAESLDAESAQKLVAMTFLGEYGTSEHYLDQLLQTIEVDDNSFTFLKFAIDRIEQNLSQTEESATTVVQSLELIETICKATYDTETSNSSGPTDDKILKSLTGWQKLEEFLPFLHTIKNLQGEYLLSLGIPAKCEELIIFIKTRGRGVASAGSNDDEKSKHTLEQVLFSINSGTPSYIGMGLIELKKLIHQRNAGVETGLDFILKTLENVLESDDEYVYNHCINVLVSLTIDHHPKLIPRMVDLYAFTYKLDTTGKPLEEERGIRYKLKMGEVLSKTFASLGSIAVNYVNLILNATSAMSNSMNAREIRVSAYQVMSALIPELGISLDDHLMRISHWAHSKLRREEDVEVQVSIWVLLEKILTAATALSKSGVVPPNTATFIKDTYALAKRCETLEDFRITGIRESVRDHASEMLRNLLDVTLKTRSPPFDIRNYI